MDLITIYTLIGNRRYLGKGNLLLLNPLFYTCLNISHNLICGLDQIDSYQDFQQLAVIQRAKDASGNDKLSPLVKDTANTF